MTRRLNDDAQAVVDAHGEGADQPRHRLLGHDRGQVNPSVGSETQQAIYIYIWYATLSTSKRTNILNTRCNNDITENDDDALDVVRSPEPVAGLPEVARDVLEPVDGRREQVCLFFPGTCQSHHVHC